MINLKGIRIFQHDLVRIQRGIEYDIHILVRGFIRINGNVNIRGYRFLLNESYLDVSEYINISTDDLIHNISVIQERFYIRKIINGPSMSKKSEDELCKTQLLQLLSI
jgi:hypothetical protein